MKTKVTSTNKYSNNFISIALAVIAILMIPLVAMQFTDEVKWTLIDFIAAGIILFGFGLVCEFILSKTRSTKYRILLVSLLMVLLIIFWAELAVGLFGTPISGS